MISASLDYIPISFFEYLLHLFYTFSCITKNKYIHKSDHYKILGYSCRSLFDTTMKYYTDEKQDLKIITTPIHHTSFRNIIEKYIKPENIHILDMNSDYTKIVSVPEIEADLCIITHTFGKDLDCSILQEYRNKHQNCIFIEDRVQGGTLDKLFSHLFMDVSLYSTGMDKKPCGLGGGFICIRNLHHQMAPLGSYILCNINSYPDESWYSRIIFLLKKIPTLLLYNCKWFIQFIQVLFFTFGWNLHSFAKYYRKKNPGFSHAKYNLNPSNGTLLSIHYSLKNYSNIEYLYSKRSEQFFRRLNDRTKKEMFPWYDNNSLLTPYNTIRVKNHEKFIDYFNKRNIPLIENPTYKMFNFDYKDREKYELFNNSLFYLPSLSILNDEEIIQLAKLINKYYLIDKISQYELKENKLIY